MGETPFKFNECDKAFRKSTLLTQHFSIYIRSGERPFQCDECDKAYMNSSALVNRNREHSGERPFKCNEFDNPFTQSSALTQHMLRHGIRGYTVGKDPSSAMNVTRHSQSLLF